MFVFNVQDNYGNEIHDYDMILLAGENYEPSKLHKGFFLDRQMNNQRYLNILRCFIMQKEDIVI